MSAHILAPHKVPIPFLAPIAKLPHEQKREHQGGIAQLVNLFEVPEDTPAKTKVETKEERKARLAGEKEKLNSIRIQEYLEAALYDPTEITDAIAENRWPLNLQNRVKLAETEWQLAHTGPECIWPSVSFVSSLQLAPECPVCRLSTWPIVQLAECPAGRVSSWSSVQIAESRHSEQLAELAEIRPGLSWPKFD